MSNNESIYPVIRKVGDISLEEGGLTKREYFALQILLNQPNFSSGNINLSIEIADELLNTLKQYKD